MAKEFYSIAGDFSSGVLPIQLHEEISGDGTVGSIFEGVVTEGDVCAVRLTVSPDGSQKTALDAVIAAHVPNPGSTSEDEGKGDLLGAVHYKQSKAESSSANKNAWKQKIVMTTAEIIGKVRISWCYQWKYSHTATKINVRVTVDGTEIWMHEQEPKDPNNWHPVDAKLYETLTQGVHTIVLEYKPTQNGKTAEMKNALIEVKEFRED